MGDGMSSGPRRLLIVEDDQALRQLLSLELEDRGYRVTTAASCAEARAAMRSSRFDLALLDFRLPDGNGTDLVAELRSIDPKPTIVVSSGQRVPLPAGSGSGVRFAPKPVSTKTLDELFGRGST